MKRKANIFGICRCEQCTYRRAYVRGKDRQGKLKALARRFRYWKRNKGREKGYYDA